MAKCELSIKLDQPDRTYAFAETVKGTVEVRTEEDCECRKLTLSRGWKADMAGDVVAQLMAPGAESGPRETFELFSGRWSAGEHTSCPFEFQAPRGPRTYQGQRLDIRWWLQVQLDVPLGQDVTSEQDFLLVPGESPGPIDLGPGHSPSPVDPTGVEVAETSGNVVVMILGAAMFLPTLASLEHVASIFLSRGGSRNVLDAFFSLVAGGLFALFGTFLLRYAVGQVRARTSLKSFKVDAHPKELAPEGTIECRLSFEPRRELAIEEATAKLVLDEVVSFVDREGRIKTNRWPVYQDNVTLASNRRVVPGGRVYLDGKLRVPPGAPYTFRGQKYSLDWQITVRFKAKYQPELLRMISIVVQP